MVFSQHAYTHHVNLILRDRPVRPEYREDPRLEVAAFSSYAAISREWKYFYSAPDGREFLFDKLRDPSESRNRAAVPFCGPALEEHREALFSFLRAGGETAGLEEDDWKPFPRRRLDDDPDAGLLIQDSYTPWAEMEIPGYTD